MHKGSLRFRCPSSSLEVGGVLTAKARLFTGTTGHPDTSPSPRIDTPLESEVVNLMLNGRQNQSRQNELVRKSAHGCPYAAPQVPDCTYSWDSAILSATFRNGRAEARRRLLRGCRSVASSFPADREKRRHVGQADVAGQDRQNVGEILERIDACETAAAEDGEGDRGALAAVVASSEEKILTCDRAADVEPLGGAVVDRNHSIGEESTERDVVIQHVANRGAELR